MNKLGQAGDFVNKAYIGLVAIVIIAVIIACLFALSIIAPPILTTSAEMKDLIGDVIPRDDIINGTDAFDSTFTPLQKGINGLDYFAFALLIGLVVGWFIFLYFTRTNGLMIPMWFFVGFIFIFVSIIIAGAYWDIAEASPFGTGIIAPMDFLLKFLPLFVAGLVMVGGIILVVIPKSSDLEAGGL